MKLLQLIPLMAIIACGDKEDTGEETTSEAAEDTEAESSEENTEPDLANGESVHNSVCMNCHAQNQDIEHHVPEMTDEELSDLIQNGNGQMPATAVSGQDLIDLIAYLRAEYP